MFNRITSGLFLLFTHTAAFSEGLQIKTKPKSKPAYKQQISKFIRKNKQVLGIVGISSLGLLGLLRLLSTSKNKTSPSVKDFPSLSADGEEIFAEIWPDVDTPSFEIWNLLQVVYRDTFRVIFDEIYIAWKKTKVGTEASERIELKDYQALEISLFESNINPKNNILVQEKDCILAAQELYQENSDNSIALLNMANENHPGGACAQGASAQEEEIFRRTDASLDIVFLRGLYPLAPFSLVVHPDVMVIRQDKDKGFKLFADEDRFPITLLHAAAYNKTLPNNNQFFDKTDNFSEQGYKNMVKKVASLFDAAMKAGCSNLVLGAWGCGVYDNPPDQVAEIMIYLASVYSGNFEKIVFPIIKSEKNLNAFKQALTIFNDGNGIKTQGSFFCSNDKFVCPYTSGTCPWNKEGVTHSKVFSHDPEP